MTDAVKYPAWEAAQDAFLQEGFQPEQVIPHAWFYQALDIVQPTPDMRSEKADRLRLKFLNHFEKLKVALRENHKIDLQSVQGQGYTIVPPKDQARLAYADTLTGMGKIIREGVSRAANVKTEGLTDEQQRQQVECLARISIMKEMSSRQRRLPAPE